jgi:hypothetical protein
MSRVGQSSPGLAPVQRQTLLLPSRAVDEKLIQRLGAKYRAGLQAREQAIAEIVRATKAGERVNVQLCARELQQSRQTIYNELQRRGVT